MVRYAIDKVNRIDSRYYLIRINKNYYVVDYSNPKDPRNWFFVPFFQKRLREFVAYDVTGDEKKYIVDNFWKYQGFIGKVIGTLFVLTFIDGILMPDALNVFYWTKEDSILSNWFLWLKVLVLGALLIIMILNLTVTMKTDMSKYKKVILTDIYPDDKINFIKKNIVGFLGMWMVYLILFVAAVFGKNYASLTVFGFVSIYTCCFIKFIEFRPSMRKQKFYIKEYEEE